MGTSVKYWIEGSPLAENGADPNVKYWLYGSPYASIATPDYFLSFGDAITLSDSVTVFVSNTIINLSFGDSFTLSDASTVQLLTPIELAAGDQIEIFDELIIKNIGLYNLTLADDFTFLDAVTTALLVPAINRSVSDTLSFSDLVQILSTIRQSEGFGDTLAFADHARIQLSAALSAGDTLDLQDSVSLSLDTFSSFGDTLNLQDSVTVSLFANIQISVSDTLSLSDAATILNSTTFTGYIRRYLNDVLR